MSISLSSQLDASLLLHGDPAAGCLVLVENKNSSGHDHDFWKERSVPFFCNCFLQNLPSTDQKKITSVRLHFYTFSTQCYMYVTMYACIIPQKDIEFIYTKGFQTVSRAFPGWRRRT